MKKLFLLIAVVTCSLICSCKQSVVSKTEDLITEYTLKDFQNRGMLDTTMFFSNYKVNRTYCGKTVYIKQRKKEVEDEISCQIKKADEFVKKIKQAKSEITDGYSIGKYELLANISSYEGNIIDCNSRACIAMNDRNIISKLKDTDIYSVEINQELMFYHIMRFKATVNISSVYYPINNEIQIKSYTFKFKDSYYTDYPTIRIPVK